MLTDTKVVYVPENAKVVREPSKADKERLRAAAHAELAGRIVMYQDENETMPRCAPAIILAVTDVRYTEEGEESSRQTWCLLKPIDAFNGEWKAVVEAPNGTGPNTWHFCEWQVSEARKMERLVEEVRDMYAPDPVAPAKGK